MSTADTVTLTKEQAAALLISAQRGDALAGWISTTALLGHTSPAGALDYLHPQPGTAQAFVADFVAWTSGRKDMAPGCEVRLREWGMDEYRERMSSVADRLMGGAA